MKYGLEIPNGEECGNPRTLAELARLAEESGWDGFFLEDYIVYYTSEDPPTYDPWVSLTAIALSTERIRIGTVVTPLPRRRPWKLAREVLTLDDLSGGRVILGVGLGASDDASFASFSEETDARRRAGMLDEGLEILAGLLSGEPFSFEGEHYSVDDVTFRPAPVRSSGIPIWVGGSTQAGAVIRRAARCDGIVPYKLTDTGEWEDFTPEEVQDLRERIGSQRTSSAQFDIAIGGRRRREDWELERSYIRSLAEAGATWWMEGCPAADLDAMRAAIARGPLRVD